MGFCCAKQESQRWMVQRSVVSRRQYFLSCFASELQKHVGAAGFFRIDLLGGFKYFQIFFIFTPTWGNDPI